MIDPVVQPLHIEILSNPALLRAVRVQVEQFATQLNLPERYIGELMLVIDEALTNIIRHAYDGAADQKIELDLSVAEGSLCITIRDYGKTVEPHRIQSRNLEDIRPGGLGVHIMRSCMDTVEYQHAENGGTKLTMRRSLAEMQKIK